MALRVFILLTLVVAVAADAARPETVRAHKQAHEGRGYGRSGNVVNPRREKMNYFDKAAELTKQNGQLERAANQIVSDAKRAGDLLGGVQENLNRYHTDLNNMSNLLEGPVKNIADNLHAEFGRLAEKEPARLAAFDVKAKGGLSWSRRVSPEAGVDGDDSNSQLGSVAAALGTRGDGEDSDSLVGVVEGRGSGDSESLGGVLPRVEAKLARANAMKDLLGGEEVFNAEGSEGSDSVTGVAKVSKPVVTVTKLGPDGKAKEVEATFTVEVPKRAAVGAVEHEPCEEKLAKLEEKVAELESVGAPGMAEQLREGAIKSGVVTKSEGDLVLGDGQGTPTNGLPANTLQTVEGVGNGRDGDDDIASEQDVAVPAKPPVVAASTSVDNAGELVGGLPATSPVEVRGGSVADSDDGVQNVENAGTPPIVSNSEVSGIGDTPIVSIPEVSGTGDTPIVSTPEVSVTGDSDF